LFSVGLFSIRRR